MQDFLAMGLHPLVHLLCATMQLWLYNEHPDPRKITPMEEIPSGDGKALCALA